jgi:DNA-directed RNA polymerase beta' subunit
LKSFFQVYFSLWKKDQSHMKKFTTSFFWSSPHFFSVKNSSKNFSSFSCFSGNISTDQITQAERSDQQKTETPFFARKKIVRGYSKIHELKLVTIGIASPEKIQFWAEKELPNGKIFGEVTNANTFHYRTFKPSKGGLFCERIFGPLKDFECACGKRQRPTALESRKILEHKQTVRSFCPNCDVEYTWSILRRYQLGYIKLSAPVLHLWYFKTNPSYLSILFDMKRKDLESLIYCTETVTLENIWNFSEKTASFQQSPTKLYDTWQKFFQKEEKIKNSQQKFLLKKAKKRQKKAFFRQSFQEKHLEKETWKNFLKERKTLPLFQEKNEDSQKSLQTQSILQQNFFQKRKHSFHLLFHENWKQSLFDTVKYASGIASSDTNSSLSVFQTLFGLSSLFLFAFQQKKTNLTQTAFLKKDAFFDEKIWKSFFSGLEVLKYFEQNKLNSQKIFEPIPKENFLLFLNFVPLYKKILFFKKTEFHTNSALLRKIQKRLGENDKKVVPFLSKSGNFSFVPFFEKPTIEKKQASLKMFEAELETFIQEKTSKSSLNFENSIFSFEYFSDFQMILEKSKENSNLKMCSVLVENSEAVENFLFSENQTPKDFVCFLKKDSLSFDRNTEKKSESQKLLFSFFSVFFSPLNLQEKRSRNQNLFVPSFMFSSSVDFAELLQTSKNEQKKKSEKIIEIFNSSSSLKKDVCRKQRKNQRELIFKYFSENSFEEKMGESLKIVKSEKKLGSFHSLIFHGIREKNGEKSEKRSKSLKLKKNFQLLGKTFSIQNMVSTIAYNQRWGNDSDWKYFAYFLCLFSSEMDQSSIFLYRFVPPNSKSSVFFPSEKTEWKDFPKTHFSVGAGIVEKFLTEYTPSELRKMVKQHQILLPKIQQSIRFLKQTAKKKKDFLQIQKYVQKREHILRRLKLLRKFSRRNSNPQSMILKNLPVLPPDLRPILKLQNQIAASDLNRFYQRILYRNERLKKFQKDSVTNQSFEIKYAQRLLQEAVDNLIQNGKGNVKPETNSRGQPLKSLSEILKGKQGRFRQYLLGKRVDYSGRSVIVVGPELKIYECGLPKEMALELFLPFLIQHILKYKLAQTVIGAKNILKSDPIFTVQLLQKVLKNSPLLLNRAPTLHRLGFQAFLPKLVEGRAILLHPMVCPGFNADFDGDQMAVHIPLTVEARTEAWKFMLSANNLLNAATGEPILLPSQDMVLGCYFLTLDYQRKFVGVQVTNSERNQRKKTTQKENFQHWLQQKKSFLLYKNFSTVLQDYQKQKIGLHTPVWVQINSKNSKLDFGNDSSKPREIRLRKNGQWEQILPKYTTFYTPENFEISKYIRTTPGRVLMNSMIQECSSVCLENP